MPVRRCCSTPPDPGFAGDVPCGRRAAAAGPGARVGDGNLVNEHPKSKSIVTATY
jgi:hypothetical protein